MLTNDTLMFTIDIRSTKTCQLRNFLYGVSLKIANRAFSL